jgi:hypothetical protein
MRARGELRETPVNLRMHHHRWTRLTMLDIFCPWTGTWSIWLAHVHGLHIDYFSVCKIIQLLMDVQVHEQNSNFSAASANFNDHLTMRTVVLSIV